MTLENDFKAMMQMAASLKSGALDRDLVALKKLLPKSGTSVDVSGTLNESLARFEEGESADPTENMSEEDAAKWKERNEEHKDNFKSASSLLRKIQQILIDDEFEVRKNYSGRGMYQSIAPLAIVTDVAPHTTNGKKLIGLGMSYDNMGRGWIYYIHDKRQLASSQKKKLAGKPNLNKWRALVPGAEVKNSIEQRALDAFWSWARGELNEAVDLDTALEMAAWDLGYQKRRLTFAPGLVELAKIRKVDIKREYADGLKQDGGKHAAIEEGSRVPDGWASSPVKEPEPEIDVGSEIPDGAGNQTKRAWRTAFGNIWREIDRDLNTSSSLSSREREEFLDLANRAAEGTLTPAEKRRGRALAMRMNIDSDTERKALQWFRGASRHQVKPPRTVQAWLDLNV